MARVGDIWPARPGDYAWLVATEYADVGQFGSTVDRPPMVLRVYDPEKDPDGPSHISIRLPDKRIAQLALRGRGTQGNGHTWEWKGEDLEKPTLRPSIAPPAGSTGWHGWLTNGELSEAG